MQVGQVPMQGTDEMMMKSDDLILVHAPVFWQVRVCP